MKIQPLATEETVSGFTHMATLTYSDLTQTSTGAAQTLTLLSLGLGAQIGPVAMEVITPFQNTADNAFNTTTVSVGDSNGGVATLLTAKEANANGTVSKYNRGAATVGYQSGGTATSLTVTFNSQTGKALANLNAGELRVLFAYAATQRFAEGGV